MKLPTGKDALIFAVFLFFGMFCGLCIFRLVGAETLKVYTDIFSVIVTAFATGAVALFTWRLWHSTEKLWGAGERQLEHAKTSSERQLRAYVFPKTVGAQLILINNNLVANIEVMISNFGQTPAYEMVCWIGVALLQYPYNGPFPDSTDEYPPGPMAQSVNFILDRHVVFNPIIYSEIQQSHLGMFAFGVIDYEDAFGNKWRTRFRFQCVGLDVQFFNFKKCMEGNGEESRD